MLVNVSREAFLHKNRCVTEIITIKFHRGRKKYKAEHSVSTRNKSPVVRGQSHNSVSPAEALR